LKRRLTLGALVLGMPWAWGQDRSTRAEKALTELLFTEDADDFTAYRFINSRGYVEISFASNTPRDTAKGLLDKIRALPDVAGARENFGGSPCKRF
jgi:hypothetical protein